MKNAKITFDLLSYWHMGSGTGEGANLDAVVVKDAAGLPYIPGRTIKGLLREAVCRAEELTVIPAGVTEKLFGTPPRTVTRFETNAGLLQFESATLGAEMARWAAEPGNRAALAGLYHQVASTRIDEHGLAQDETLRRIEVTIPVTLHATITGPDEQVEWLPVLAKASKLIRGIGSHRHRGLGRVSVRIEEVQA
jgi:CRISPR/Cas system CSM-associated protein Csm3 (group 7 of RAMP superfamily)